MLFIRTSHYDAMNAYNDITMFNTICTAPIFYFFQLTQKQQIDELFSNYTLGNEPEDVNQENIYKPWHRPNVFVTLATFTVMQVGVMSGGLLCSPKVL